MLTESQLDQLAWSTADLAALKEAFRKTKKKAGKAAKDPEGASRDLEEAIEVFSASPYANLTLDEIAAAGGRIQRLAKQCELGNSLPDLARRVEEAEATHWELLRETRGD